MDKYHVVQLLNQAVDAIRRREQRSHPELKNSRYWWLKKPSKLTVEQRRGLAEHRRRYRTIARAYQLKLEFDEFWEQPTNEDAELYLIDWCLRVHRSRLPIDPLKTFVDTLIANWERILRWFQSRINNGILEAINSRVQAAKRRARRYRSDRHYIAMIYMTAGKLNFALPT